MSNLKRIVSEKFYKRNMQPQAKNVGDMIKLLQELPADLEIRRSINVQLFNIDFDPHIEITEIR